MKLRRNALEIAAYAASALVLCAAGQLWLARGWDRLSALTADFTWWLLPAWALAMVVAGAASGAILVRRDRRFHIPASLCFGLLAARLTDPPPRVSRIEPLLADFPGWPWAFAVELLLWLGLLWLGVQAAEWVARALGAEPHAAGDESRPVWADTDEPNARRLAPDAVRMAQGVALFFGALLLPVFLLDEVYKQSTFAVGISFLLSGSLVLGYWPRGTTWQVILLPAGLGLAAYVAAGLGSPSRAGALDRFALFVLPIDYVAAGGLGALLGTHRGGMQDSIWWVGRNVLPLSDRFSIAPTRTPAPVKPAPVKPAPAQTPAPVRAPEVQPPTPAPTDRKGKKKRR